MRPHDIVILAQLVLKESQEMQNRDLAESLFISKGEVSESLNRSRVARLINPNKKSVNKHSYFDFLVHGLAYVFPGEIGTLQRGIPTAHSHEFMKEFFHSNTEYVWPDVEGEVLGLTINPLYENQVKAAKKDTELHKFLALLDVLRVGKVREMEIAKEELQKIILK